MPEIQITRISSEEELTGLIDERLSSYPYARLLAEALCRSTMPGNWHLVTGNHPAHDAAANGDTILRLIGVPINSPEKLVRFVAGAFHINSSYDQPRWIRSGLLVHSNLYIPEILEDPRKGVEPHYSDVFLEGNDNELNGIGHDGIKLGISAQFRGFHEFPGAGTIGVTNSSLARWLFGSVIPYIMDRSSDING